MQVAVLDVHGRAVEDHVGVAVVARVYFFAVLDSGDCPTLASGTRQYLEQRRVPPACRRGRCSGRNTRCHLHGIFIVDSELVLVAPEPDHRSMNEFRQLLRRNLVPLAERGMAAVMRKQNQAAIIAVGIHYGLNPRD